MAKYIKTEDGYKLKVGENVTGKTYIVDDKKVVADHGAEVFNNYESNIASGLLSHAEGHNTTASGSCSHAEGSSTTASGSNSHAEGHDTTAFGEYSHAEGRNTTASEYYSHAEGFETTASGTSSHAEGLSTTASGDNQHTQGKYNIVDEISAYAHIVGNGTADSDRSNAHTLDWNGVGWYQGGLQVGGNAQDDGAKNVLLEGDALNFRNISVTMPSVADWNAVTYGDGKFVAVSCHNSNGAITAYSKDGIIWTQKENPSDGPVWYDWISIAHGNGKFVAITNSKNVAYSDDGIAWTLTLMPASASWSSVAYGDGKFVAVSGDRGSAAPQSSDVAAYSTDGITWTQTIMPKGAWSSVAYGDGKFVAVSTYIYGTNICAYSEDGINWSSSNMESAFWSSITYGDGKFVAVADSAGISGRPKYSTNGKIWTSARISESAPPLHSVAYGDGKFVAISNVSDIAAYSADGITWTLISMPASVSWSSVVYGDGKFVAVSTASDKVAYSTDGIIWHDYCDRIEQNNADVTNDIKELIVGCNPIPTPETATVGQVVRVSKIDDNGKPIAWEAVDASAHTHTSEDVILTDTSTGTQYKLSVTDGKLNLVTYTE